MAVLKKHLTPIGKGGVTVNRGKGSQQTTMPFRNSLNALQKNPNPTINDYSKADSMSQPAGDAASAPPPSLGSGSWPGGLA